MLSAKRDYAARSQEMCQRWCRVGKSVVIALSQKVILRTSKLVRKINVNPCLQRFAFSRYDNGLISFHRGPESP